MVQIISLTFGRAQILDRNRARQEGPKLSRLQQRPTGTYSVIADKRRSLHGSCAGRGYGPNGEDRTTALKCWTLRWVRCW